LDLTEALRSGIDISANQPLTNVSQMKINSSYASRIAVALLVSMTAITGWSCGGGDGGHSCGAAQTCGGDVVGTWKATSSCFAATPGAFSDQNCPTLKVDVSNLTVSGTDTFNVDKTELSTVTLGGSMALTYPGSCLSSGGTAISCDQLTSNVAAGLADPTNNTPFSSVTCKAGGGGCVCTIIPAPTPTNETSTYTTSGAILAETDSMGKVTESTYCVSEKTMIQHVDGMMMGNDGLIGTVTLTKQ
jgi:hypothetical protein